MGEDRGGPKFTAEFYKQIISYYPQHVRAFYERDAPRLAFMAQFIFSLGGVFADIGSGFSPLALGLQKAGMQSAMVDRFNMPVYLRVVVDPESVLQVLGKEGVKIHWLDVVHAPLPFSDASVDSLVCSDLIEHLHQSPRPLLRELVRILKPGGRCLLACPNAVNLRKRISVLFAKTNYPPLHDYWEEGDPVWFGHVREPTLPEMAWMAKAVGFEIVQLFGRNFVGRENYGALAAMIDPVLRVFPSLCSDIFVLARKSPCA